MRGGGESSSEEDESSEEEDKSSEEEDAVTDIEITEKFDEVVFGDGDESHQIYTNMSGIIITWNTCTEDTFNVLREELADMCGVDPQAFYIAHYSKLIRDEFRASDLPNGAWVSINIRLRGGGTRPGSAAGLAAGPSDGRAKTRVQRLLLLGSDARTALEDATVPKTERLQPVLQRFREMMGMQDDGSFDDNVAQYFLRNLINTADVSVLNLMLAEIDAVTQKEVFYFHKAMTYALVADYKAIELACDEFQKVKSVQVAVMAYIYAHLAMTSDNGQHNNTAVKNMIIERKREIEKQAEPRQGHEMNQKFVAMARDQLLAEARQQLIAEARQQLIAEARQQLIAETQATNNDEMQL